MQQKPPLIDVAAPWPSPLPQAMVNQILFAELQLQARQDSGKHRLDPVAPEQVVGRFPVPVTLTML